MTIIFFNLFRGVSITEQVQIMTKGLVFQWLIIHDPKNGYDAEMAIIGLADKMSVIQ